MTLARSSARQCDDSAAPDSLATPLNQFGSLRTYVGVWVTYAGVMWPLGSEKRSSAIRTGILATAAFSLVAEAASTPVRRQNSSISWFDCPDSNKTQCAFFDVPRDYSNPANDDTVSIFLRKLPASASEENRLGTILTNPGGPGGSGNAFVETGGAEISALLDGRYDIIGFDPRYAQDV
ncbi:hypothetical protein FRC08_002807 [Ceratobasidium sp. 394]|nr:hypothetical protein FRC08_002807 [Ceratobasidium sp. 394]